jgi:hypothetical protein
MPSMKIIFAIAFLGIVVALGSAGLFMLRGPRGDDERGSGMARALAWRVGVSVALFLFILVSYKLGWIRPSGIPISA